MRTLKYNGEFWYVDERTLATRIAEWFVWFGGWSTFKGWPLAKRLRLFSVMTVVYFEGKLGWYWRLTAGNNRTIAIGAEPFTRPSSVRRAFRKLGVQVARERIDPTPRVHTKRKETP